jgi:hypothetical protein
MRRLSGVLLLIVVGCGAAAVETTTSAAATVPTTLLPTTTTTLAGAVDECPPAPYEVTFLPINVNEAGFDPSGLEPDVWTSVGGSQTTFFGRSDGTVAIAVVRGALPAVDWPAEKGEIDIDGIRAAVGPHPDGTWVAGWIVAPEARCDLYSVIFYPPWNPKDVEAVLLSMRRLAG